MSKKQGVVCNKDCFNCEYTDCINDKLDESDIIEQNTYLDVKHHSTPQQLKDAKNSYYRHREERLAKNKKYYYANRDKFREYDRRRKVEHPVSPEKRREYYVRWRDKKKAEQGGEGLMGNINRGKQFESQVRECMQDVKDTFVLRLLDPMSGYAGVRNICDFVIYHKPFQLLLECKTHYGKSLPFSCITENQWQGMLAASATPGLIAGVILWLIDCDSTYFIPIETLEFLKQNSRKQSVSFDDLKKLDSIGDVFKIVATKKRTLFNYEFEYLFDELKQSYELC